MPHGLGTCTVREREPSAPRSRQPDPEILAATLFRSLQTVKGLGSRHARFLIELE